MAEHLDSPNYFFDTFSKSLKETKMGLRLRLETYSARNSTILSLSFCKLETEFEELNNTSEAILT